MCGSRKYPYPYHRENWKFWRGGGESKTQEIPEGRGLDDQFSFQMSFNSIWIKSIDLAVQKSFLTNYVDLSQAKTEA